MKLSQLIFAATLPITFLTSCDDGKIFDNNVITQEEGVTVKMTGNISGLDSWVSGYEVAVAGFGDSEYAVISKDVIANADGSDAITVVMAGVTSEVNTIELCVIDRLRKRVATFKSMECNQSSDTIHFDVGNIRASMHNAIQQSVFNVTCAQCHGGSNFAAAGLYLTEGKSYDAMVGVDSKLITGDMIVNPGDASTSSLYKTLSSNVSSTWSYDHSVEVLSTTTLDLIKNWIDNGAKH